ncbi:hypothetical protein GY45DRAFT_1376119 [Cubamyces sp. BRFM 1775]|nr:hypothetical protein GY45DRAFT_1376119 [Cubamyces sp. BRFM 1775]
MLSAPLDLSQTILSGGAGAPSPHSELAYMQAQRTNTVEQPVNILLRSPDDLKIVASDPAGSIAFLSEPSFEEVARIACRSATIAMCWAELDERPALVCLCLDRKLRIWKLDANYLPARRIRATVIYLDSPPIDMGMIAYEGNHMLLAVATRSQLWTWQLGSKAVPLGGLISTSDSTVIAHIQFIPDTSRLMLFYRNQGKIVEYDVKQEEIMLETRITDRIDVVAFTRDDQFVTGNRRALELHSVRTISPPTNPERSYTYAPVSSRTLDKVSFTMLSVVDGGTLLSCMETGEIYIWDISSWSFRGAFRSKNGKISGLLTMPIKSSRDVTLGHTLVLASSTGLETWEVYRDDSHLVSDFINPDTAQDSASATDIGDVHKDATK